MTGARRPWLNAPIDVTFGQPNRSGRVTANQVEWLIDIAGRAARMDPEAIRTARRRWNDWDPAGFPASTDGPRGRGGDHPDPVGSIVAAYLDAKGPPEVPPAQAVDDLIRAWREFERHFVAATRPTGASRIELETTQPRDDLPARRSASAGFCDACGQEFVGRGGSRLTKRDGFRLCNTHLVGAGRNAAKGQTTAEYVRSMRAMFGLELPATSEAQ